MSWALSWFYCGDVKCLINGGTFGPENPTADNNLIAKLASWTTDTTGAARLMRIFHSSHAEPDPNGEWPLISAVRSLVESQFPGGPHQWERFFTLEVKLRRVATKSGDILPEDFKNEILLTPTSLVLPWPFPVVQTSNVYEDFKRLRAWVDEHGDVPTLQPTDYLPGRDLRLNSVVTAVEELVQTANLPPGGPDAPAQEAASHMLQKLVRGTNPVARWSAISAYAASPHVKKRVWREFQLPVGDSSSSPTDVVAYPNVRLDATWLAFDQDRSLRLHVGQVYQHRIGPELEPWPCGERSLSTKNRAGAEARASRTAHG